MPNEQTDGWDELDLRDEINRLRRERNNHLMDEPDYVDAIIQIIQSHEQEAERRGRKTAKEENARDFDSIVEAFNRAVYSEFKETSINNLRMVINGADARAKYADLPVQQLTQQEGKKT